MKHEIVFKEFSPKDPTERVVLSMNFGTTKVMGTATIVSCTWFSLPYSGEDPAATSMISGSCDVTSSPIVKQLVINGVVDVDYYMRAEATLSDGRILVGTAKLSCVAGA